MSPNHCKISTKPQVEVKCEIGHKDCSSYEVNGVEAALKGYPDVDITYTFKFCNYNDMGTDINLVPPPQSLGGLQTYNAELYSTKPGTRRKEFMFQQSFDQTLGQGVCEEISSTATVNTSRSKLFQKAVLQGPQMSEGSKVVGGYCFAYAFNMIDFKYDYGLGECKVHVSLFRLFKNVNAIALLYLTFTDDRIILSRLKLVVLSQMARERAVKTTSISLRLPTIILLSKRLSKPKHVTITVEVSSASKGHSIE